VSDRSLRKAASVSLYPTYEIEVVPRSAIRKGDTLLHISRGHIWELRVQSSPVSRGYGKSVEVYWPGDAQCSTYALSHASGYLRLARSP
jgi:hypothetical protein